MANYGMKEITATLKELKGSFLESFLRHPWPPRSARERSQAIFQNFFLHIQSARIHLYSLKPAFTMGLGLISFFLFLLLTISGIFLMVYYNPTTELAYINVKDISFVVDYGRYIRNIHRWGAHGMVFAVLLHMVRVFYTGSYKRSRKFNWIIGLLLLTITMGLSYTGYLLPWDQLAYWAVTIGANIAASFSEITNALSITRFIDIGSFNKQLLIGGNTIGQEALTRFYLLHIIILPIICITLIGVHFWRIRKDGGLSRPDNADEIIKNMKSIADMADGIKGKQEKSAAADKNKTYGLMELVKDRTPQVDLDLDNTVPMWPTGVWAEISVLMVTLSAMLFLSYFFDAPLKEIANPSVPENPAKAPWYFLGLQELVSYSAFMGGIGIPAIVMIGLALIPYIDKEEREFGVWFSGAEGRSTAGKSVLFSAVSLILILAFTVKLGWLRNWFPGIPQIIITFLNPGTIIVFLFAAWSVYIIKLTGSRRMGAVALFTCFLAGFIILTIMGTYFRGPNWDFYWSPSQWPVH